MSKKKKKEEVIEAKVFEITSATIKDDFCNYSFDIRTGIGAGDSLNVKGNGIIDPDMRKAFEKFNAHLACIDDVFKHSDVEIKNIDKMHNHELTGLYEVTGFKIKGGEENESIILIGNKYVSSASGRIELETPRVLIATGSGYVWYNELKEAADAAREEVRLHKEGKYTAVEPEDSEDPNQLSILDEEEGEGEF